MNRFLLGRVEHWVVLAVFAAALYTMGALHLHVRAFVTFWTSLFALVVLALGFIVLRHQPGDRITREAFEGASASAGARDQGDAAGEE